MQPVQHIPIETLPGAVVIVQGEIEKRKDGVIECSEVNIHRTFHPDPPMTPIIPPAVF